MAFSSQAFTAPSISARPKLGKKNVSSSAISGANRPKLTKTSVSSSVFSPASQPPVLVNQAIKGSYESIFRGSNVDPKYLPKKPEGIEKTLIETNSILVEIQNQLALDFASRISERDRELKAFRKASENEKRKRKEESLEGLKSFGEKSGGIISSVTKPFKSIFGKIFEFLSILATGFIGNAALKWLSDENNRQKLLNVFNFLTDNWKLFAGLLIGGIALKSLYKIIRLASGVRKILQALRILPRGRGGGTGGTSAGESVRRGGLIRNAAGERRGFNTSRLMRNGVAQTRSAAVPGSGGLKFTGVSQFTRTKNPAALAVQKAEVLVAKAGSDILKKIGMGPGAKGILGFLRPVFKRIPIFGALIDFAVSLALGEPIGRAAAKAVGAALGGALGSLIPIPGVGTLAGGILGDYVGGTIYDAMTGGKDKDKDKGDDKPKFERGGKIKGKSHAAGGTDINAEDGEFVIRKSEVPRYEPILSDINFNGGAQWEEFVKGVKLQSSLAKISFETSEKMGESFDEFKEFLDAEKLKMSLQKPKPKGPATGGSDGIRPIQSKSGAQEFIHAGDSMPMDNLNGKKTITPILVKVPDLTKPKNNKAKPSMVQLPPVVMNSNGQLPSLPTGEESKTIPKIIPYDSSNEYLNIAASAYDIVGLKFGG